MDNLILAGGLSLAGLYAAVILAAATAIFALAELYSAASSGNAGRVAAILAIVILFLIVYTGTGLWLQKSGRI